jgi:chaperone modulatory protein CbpM
MITLTALLEIVAVEEAELRFWIASGWVRPERQEPDLLFGEVDVARARLIAEMRRDLALDEDTVPLILSLVDQVYGLRHALGALCRAVGDQPEAVRDAVAEAARRHARGPDTSC